MGRRIAPQSCGPVALDDAALNQAICFERSQEPPTTPPTEVNVVLALPPRVVMAPMQTTMIRASMTAYSTAVGPSSAFTNWTTERENLRNMMPDSLPSTSADDDAASQAPAKRAAGYWDERACSSHDCTVTGRPCLR